MNYELEKYMRRCLQLARCGAAGAPPNPMVGAVLVAEGRIIGEGYHRRCGGPHAEVNALASVRERDLIPRSTLYVSLEPCAHYGKTPPCADLIIRERIPRVVVGCRDTFARVNGLGIRKMQEAGIEVVVGVLEQECRWLNRRFFTFHGEGRPWVTLKWAQSRDGFIDRRRADASVPPKVLSSPFTQVLVHRLRARSQAILVGTRTALLDNPSLTTRLWPGPNPLRLTIDRHGMLPADLRMFGGDAPWHVYPTGDVDEILSDLHRRGIQTLLVEGGATLLQTFIDAGRWDEARVETSPVTLGTGVAAPQIEGAWMRSRQLIDGHTIDWVERRREGEVKSLYSFTPWRSTLLPPMEHAPQADGARSS